MSKKLGWALIGASNIARSYMIDAIRAQVDSHIVSVLSSDKERGQIFAKEHGIANAYTDIDTLLLDENVDAVYISTTNELHHEQVLKAAKAGKHILCEKPLALNLDDAKNMVAACEEYGVTMATNHHLRNSAFFIKVKEMISQGDIGQVQYIRVFHAVNLPENLKTWRLNSNDGGGVVLDITVHDADTLAFILDEYPNKVTAISDCNKHGVESSVMMVWQYESGVLAQIHEGFNTNHAETGIEILGEKGSLVGTKCLTQEACGDLVLNQRDDNGKLISKSIEIAHHNLYIEGTRRFVDAINNEGTPAATGTDGVKSLGVALNVKRAIESQHIENVSF